MQQVIEIVEEEDKRERLYEFIANMEKDDKVLVFVGKKSVYVFVNIGSFCCFEMRFMKQFFRLKCIFAVVINSENNRLPITYYSSFSMYVL